jgi:diguanylate cyclase (GGDEF)-like protein
VNDVHGHQKGDAQLTAIGTEVAALKREVDIASRYGGDEFLIALPDTDLVGAQLFTERLAARIEDRTGLTISLGVAQTGPEHFHSLDALLQSADLSMYDSKRLQTAVGPTASGSLATGVGAGLDVAERDQLTAQHVEGTPPRVKRA